MVALSAALAAGGQAALGFEPQAACSDGSSGHAPLRFAGYAALFDRRDRGGDVIRPGAFADAAAPLPLLWQHDPTRCIGTVEAVAEDAMGLAVVAQVDAASASAREVAALLRSRAIDGLSFGYRVLDAQTGTAPGPAGTPTRDLHRLALVEVSVVTHPMQPGARVETLLG